MYTIDKEFSWDMGHRVWSQTLNIKYAEDGDLMCRRPHGHTYKAKIGLKAKSLSNGMVTDFKHLNFVKTIIDNDWDHRFMIDKNDPMLRSLFPEYESLSKGNCAKDKTYYTNFDLTESVYDKLTKERIEGFIVVDFVPTAENICKCLGEIIQNKMGEFLKENEIELAFVELWETPKSHCKWVPSE